MTLLLLTHSFCAITGLENIYHWQLPWEMQCNELMSSSLANITYQEFNWPSKCHRNVRAHFSLDNPMRGTSSLSLDDLSNYKCTTWNNSIIMQSPVLLEEVRALLYQTARFSRLGSRDIPAAPAPAWTLSARKDFINSYWLVWDKFKQINQNKIKSHSLNNVFFFFYQGPPTHR